jgi:hypothetical protein
MKRIAFAITCLLIFISPMLAQVDSVSVFQCLGHARANAAQQSQFITLSEIADLKVSNTSATNLPSLSAYGKAWYQSDAMAVPSMVPGKAGLEIDPFQYNFGLEADQKLFDGGMSQKSADVEEASRASEIYRIETEIYQIYDKVTRFAFTSMLLKNSKEVLILKQNLLAKRVIELESGVKYGVIKRNELEKLQVEQSLTAQQLMEIEKQQLQAMNSLRLLTGMELSDSINFFIPDSLLLTQAVSRPEYNYFDAEMQRIDKLTRLKSAQNLPKIYAYAQTGYSYPGLNFYENKSDYYYIVGAKLSWTIFDWKQVNRETQVLQKQKEIVDSKRVDFERNMNIALRNEEIEQANLTGILTLDDRVITQRESITQGSATALSEGTITSATYLEDLNNEIKARIDCETHKIQFLNSIVKLNLLKGIEIK